MARHHDDGCANLEFRAKVHKTEDSTAGRSGHVLVYKDHGPMPPYESLLSTLTLFEPLLPWARTVLEPHPTTMVDGDY